MATKKRLSMDRFKILNDFVDAGLRQFSRSEAFVYLILFRDTQPDGLARTSRSELAERGGMTIRQASRALQSLIKQGVVRVIHKRVPGKSAAYTIYLPDELAKLNPGLQRWLNGRSEEVSGHPCRETRDTHVTN
jgi:hypothetical protein